MSISIAVVMNTKHTFKSLSEIGQKVAQIKKDVKAIKGSNYLIFKD